MQAFAIAGVALLCVPALWGQQSSARPAEPGTGSAQVTPASKAPKPVQQPDVRLDSKPHTDIDYTLDSSPEPMDLGLGASPAIDLGHDIVATTPAGMLSRSVPGNPRMVYFSLPQRAGDTIAPADRDVLTAREGDLNSAAAHHGFDLKQPGWTYAQSLCPATEPNAQAIEGVPAAGEGSILLHFVRDGDSRESAFAALVPRDSAVPVRVVSVPRQSARKPHEVKAPKSAREDVNQAIPPASLYGNLQPVQDWIAALACIATIDGAVPSIPNEPFLSEDILTAPPPLLRLLLDGERKVIFTNRVDDEHYAIWQQAVSHRGVVRKVEREQIEIVPRPVTNPPVPEPHMITNIPEPPSHTGPEPPSPLAGTKQ